MKLIQNQLIKTNVINLRKYKENTQAKKSLVLNILIKGFVVIFLAAMIIFPSASYEGATGGLLLWFHNVLPNLLPFIILSNLMIQLNITSKISSFFYPVLGRLFQVSKEGCYPIIIGFLSGIPMGAKSTADLVSEGKISRSEGNFLITMCNNASPMFIIGYIAISQLKLPRIKYALFVIIYSSAIISALLCRYLYHKVIRRNKEAYSIKDSSCLDRKKKGTSHFSFEILDHSIMNGFEVITKIGGYIILFSIIAQIVKEIGSDTNIFKIIFMGIVEITTGINQISMGLLNRKIKIVLVAVLTSFGGLSGIAQTKSVLGSTRLSIKYYIIVKLISIVITYLLASIYVNLIL
ncbi:MAG: transporter [Clostridiales bacterium]|jgi:sporulation integral membrane protein YlbJ|nr:transporter [Clostridiales bacterium]